MVIICTFERVGSTWFMNFIDKIGRRQTEPFRQHLGSESPFCTINHLQRKIEPPYFHPSLKSIPFAQIWHRNYISCLNNADFIAKETNLFFTLGSFLDHYPKNTKVVLLSRNLYGIISSFKKKNLYQSWNYQDRYLSLKEVISHNPELSSFQAIINNTNKENWLEVLTTLFVFNCLEIDYLLFQNKTFENIEKISYENLVSKKNTVLNHLKKFLELNQNIANTEEKQNIKSASPFNIFQKKESPEDWKTILTLSDIDEIFQHTQKLIPLIKKHFSPEALDRLFELGLPTERPFVDQQKKSSISPKDLPFVLKEVSEDIPEIKYQSAESLLISSPITNLQYCQFLNWLKNLGFQNEIKGYYLFYNPNMSASRGGRIFLNTDHYHVLSGFENHPANWVTWLGAYIFSKWVKARLPLESELLSITKGLTKEIINRDFIVGDTSSISSSKKESRLLGNVKSWCFEWYYPDEIKPKKGGVFKTVSGHAWNSSSASSLSSYKPFLISARSIGIRLVKDNNSKTLHLANLKNFYNTINEPHLLDLETPEINQKIIDSLN